SSPRAVASAERACLSGFLGSSAGGLPFLDHAAAKLTVMVPTLAVLPSSAAALLSYAVTRNSLDRSLVLCQPLSRYELFGFRISREKHGRPVFLSRISLKVNTFRPSTVTVTAASCGESLTRRMA